MKHQSSIDVIDSLTVCNNLHINCEQIDLENEVKPVISSLFYYVAV